MTEQAPWTVPNRAEERGYRRKRKRVVLTFGGHETLGGLEIVVRSMTLGQAMDMQAQSQEYASAEVGSAAERAALERLLQEFGTFVESWNYLDDEGRPVGFSWELLRDDFDYKESMLIINTYREATQGVAAPLPQTSAGGPPSVEAQIPMDVASPSLAS